MKKKSWRLISVSLPTGMYTWLDDIKKCYGVSYTDQIFLSIVERPRLKSIIKKLNSSVPLTNEEIKFLTAFINRPY